MTETPDTQPNNGEPQPQEGSSPARVLVKRDSANRALIVQIQGGNVVMIERPLLFGFLHLCELAGWEVVGFVSPPGQTQVAVELKKPGPKLVIAQAGQVPPESLR